MVIFNENELEKLNDNKIVIKAHKKFKVIYYYLRNEKIKIPYSKPLIILIGAALLSSCSDTPPLEVPACYGREEWCKICLWNTSESKTVTIA